MSATFTPESDSEDELPPGWEERATLGGEVYYANHHSKSTQWTHPRTGRRKKLSENLPFGWERRILDDGKVIYVDHENQRTTFADPRLAFAVEQHKDNKISSLNSSNFRQRFDASTNALQILHGMDLSDRTAIITGANCGIGYETARSLAYHGCCVIFACRNLDKARNAIANVKKDRPSANCIPMKLDLTSLESVRLFSSEFKAAKTRLDILVLNAGVFGIDFRLTEDNCEEMFQVNYLGQVYLSHLLKEPLAKSLMPKLIYVSSESHRFSELPSIPSRIFDTANKSEFHSMLTYNRTKLLGLMFVLHAEEMWRKFGIRSIAVHPGNLVSTNLSRNFWFYRLLFALVSPWTKSAQQAAASVVFAASAPEMANVSGVYINNCFPCRESPEAQDLLLRQEFWKQTEKLLCKLLKTDFKSL